MSERASLIERAAAVLRDAVAAPVAAAPAAVDPAAPDVSCSVQTPLSRHVVLDRAHLAQAGIIMPWASTARTVEEFRIIKRNIMSSWQSPNHAEAAAPSPRVVMVTSARPREGKTYSSINLALAFAAEDSLVTVLVDADTTRADIAKGLKLPSEPGLTDLLSGDLRLSDVLVQTDLPNLLIVPPGAAGPHVPELLSSQAPSILFAEITDRYPNHVIVLDTPPCLASTAPAALAQSASQIVFVIEAEHTQRSEIESALSFISGGPQVSFLLNLVPVGASEHFGSYSSHYYDGEKRSQ